jgi:protein-disulfide isomerase
MSERVDRLVSVLLTIAVLIIAGVLVKREFFANETPTPTSVRGHRQVVDTQAIKEAGRALGSSSARLQLIVFNDLECPFCRSFHETVTQISREFPADLGIVFVHLPLPNHRLAYPAARAAECAAGHDAVGGATATNENFARMVEVMFRNQDSLGLKSWSAYAKDAGISDTVGFLACASSSTRVPRVERGIELAQEIGIGGTPAVIAEGRLLGAPPTEEQIREALARVRAGQPAFR